MWKLLLTGATSLSAFLLGRLLRTESHSKQEIPDTLEGIEEKLKELDHEQRRLATARKEKKAADGRVPHPQPVSPSGARQSGDKQPETGQTVPSGGGAGGKNPTPGSRK